MAAARAARARQLRGTMAPHEPKAATPRVVHRPSKLSYHADMDFFKMEKAAGVASSQSLKSIMASRDKAVQCDRQLRSQFARYEDDWSGRSFSTSATSKLKVRPLRDHHALAHTGAQPQEMSLDRFRPPPVHVPSDDISSPRAYAWIDLF